MGFFIDTSGSYYEGDRVRPLDFAVPQRPSVLHVWLVNAWVLDAAKQAALDRLTADDAERVTCVLDAPIMALVNQTRAEWRLWAGNNFPTLTAPERTRLGDLFWVVSIGVRTRFR